MKTFLIHNIAQKLAKLYGVEPKFSLEFFICIYNISERTHIQNRPLGYILIGS